MNKDKTDETADTCDTNEPEAKEPVQDELLERIKQLEAENARLKGEDETNAQIKAFFESFPGAEAFCDDLCGYIESAEDCVDASGLEKALITVLLQKYRSPDDISNDEGFLNEHIFNNPRVRDKIINEYIDSVKDAPSVCLKRNGLIKTQPEKPTTVSAAGELARALFRK